MRRFLLHHPIRGLTVLSVYFTVLLIAAAVGAALAFVGWLFTILMALGNKQYVWGALCFVFFPFAWYYSVVNWRKDNYGGLLLFSGSWLLLVAAVLGGLLYLRTDMHLAPS